MSVAGHSPGREGMRFVDEFRSGDVAAGLAELIAELADPDEH